MVHGPYGWFVSLWWPSWYWSLIVLVLQNNCSNYLDLFCITVRLVYNFCDVVSFCFVKKCIVALPTINGLVPAKSPWIYRRVKRHCSTYLVLSSLWSCDFSESFDLPEPTSLPRRCFDSSIVGSAPYKSAAQYIIVCKQLQQQCPLLYYCSRSCPCWCSCTSCSGWGCSDGCEYLVRLSFYFYGVLFPKFHYF